MTIARGAVEALQQVKRALREPYVWPGGYPIHTVMADGEAMSAAAVRENWCAIVRATLQGSADGWRVAGAEINWEDANLVCCHTGATLECAYPPDAE